MPEGLLYQHNRKQWEPFLKLYRSGVRDFAFCGGRRSGKTFAICQFLLNECGKGAIVNMAAMTSEQGRLGAYSDCKDIIAKTPGADRYFEVLSSPREIRAKSGGRMFFNSYQNPETAKGVACDWLYVNEANNFTKQQYTDLLASVREGVFIDYNPNIEFWVDEVFPEEHILHSTWKDNEFLTPLQLKYFEDLKAAAESPNASALDIRNYNVYYLGKYSEMRGAIFLECNLTFADEEPDGLHDVKIFCDPSALRGADYFACVLSGKGADGKVYILDTFSPNTGTREMVCKKLREWCCLYDDVRIWVETNGIIGIDFYDFAYNSGLPVEAWHSKDNKFNRIIANYQNIIERVVFVNRPTLHEFMAQVYDFDTKCEHDDNIDAISSTYTLQSYL